MRNCKLTLATLAFTSLLFVGKLQAQTYFYSANAPIPSLPYAMNPVPGASYGYPMAQPGCGVWVQQGGFVPMPPPTVYYRPVPVYGPVYVVPGGYIPRRYLINGPCF